MKKLCEIKTSFVLPVCNEENVVLSIINQVKEVMNKTKYECEIIAVDDDSTDKSGKILDMKVETEVKGNSSTH